MPAGMPLRIIGYWVNWQVLDYDEQAKKLCAAELDLPDPVRLVEAVGRYEAPAEVLSYLETGRERMACLGHSWCRFRCGVEDEEMGCRELTDGIWAWPEGLVHYVRVHGVPLPREFLGTIAAHDGKVPEVSRLPESGSLGFWKDWYRGVIE